MYPLTTTRSFHNVPVQFARTGGLRLAIRLVDVATALGFCSSASLTRSSGVNPVTISSVFGRASHGIDITDIRAIIKGCSTPEILKTLFIEWLSAIEKEVKQELGIKDKPLLGIVPPHLQTNRLTVRAFMALHNLELTDRNAQRLGVRATAFRKDLNVAAAKVEVNIQLENGAFISREENNYPHNILVKAFTELFLNQ